MNRTQSKQMFFQMIDKHLFETGCDYCMKNLANILYHCQTDHSLKSDLDILMTESDLGEFPMTESSEDFNKNIERMEKEFHGKKD
jgi:hypothetical protein